MTRLTRRVEYLIIVLMLVGLIVCLYYGYISSMNRIMKNGVVTVARIESLKVFGKSPTLVLNYNDADGVKHETREEITSGLIEFRSYHVGQKILVMYNALDPEEQIVLMDMPIVLENQDTSYDVINISTKSAGVIDLPYYSVPGDDSLTYRDVILYEYDYKGRRFKGCRYLTNAKSLAGTRKTYVVVDSTAPWCHYLQIDGYKNPEEFYHSKH